MKQSPSSEASQYILQLVKKFPAFMEHESPSPYPQVLATCPYPEPTPSSETVLLHQNNVLFQENYKRSQNEQVLYNEWQKVPSERSS
jgi:hypothetical protein